MIKLYPSFYCHGPERNGADEEDTQSVASTQLGDEESVKDCEEVDDTEEAASCDFDV